MPSFDLGAHGLRALNSTLHALKGQTNETQWDVVNPRGSHAIAAGVDALVDITVHGSTGYYCAGMNKQATIRIKGSAGPGVAENMMSGTVIVDGDASQYGATGRGGLLVIKGNAIVALRDLDEGIRHRCPRLHRPHVGLHGAARRATWSSLVTPATRWATACTKRGFRARQSEKPWCGLHREGDARRASGAPAKTLRRERRMRKRSPKSSAAMALPGSSTTSISTTLTRTEVVT